MMWPFDRLFGADIFISYASEDIAWAEAIEKLLRLGRFRVYRDRSDLQLGEPLASLLDKVRPWLPTSSRASQCTAMIACSVPSESPSPTSALRIVVSEARANPSSLVDGAQTPLDLHVGGLQLARKPSHNGGRSTKISKGSAFASELIPASQRSGALLPPRHPPIACKHEDIETKAKAVRMPERERANDFASRLVDSSELEESPPCQGSCRVGPLQQGAEVVNGLLVSTPRRPSGA